MRYVVMAIICLSLVGCGSISREVAKATGYSTECVDGVTYLQFPSGTTVKFDQTGHVVPC